MCRFIFSSTFILFSLAIISSSSAKKPVAIDKNANTDFIRMEGGAPAIPPNKPLAPTNSNPSLNQKPVEPLKPINTASKPTINQQNPVKSPTNPVIIQSKPVNNLSKPVNNQPLYPGLNKPPSLTPEPGPVQHLITYYDSQGKASVIRPYSYSDAVKKGNN